ncbi:MAG: hypothetical protein ACYS8W_18345 [Planctomycetota bacterium]|jgi:hypothetical protein
MRITLPVLLICLIITGCSCKTDIDSRTDSKPDEPAVKEARKEKTETPTEEYSGKYPRKHPEDYYKEDERGISQAMIDKARELVTNLGDASDLEIILENEGDRPLYRNIKGLRYPMIQVHINNKSEEKRNDLCWIGGCA